MLILKYVTVSHSYSPELLDLTLKDTNTNTNTKEQPLNSELEPSIPY